MKKNEGMKIGEKNVFLIAIEIATKHQEEKLFVRDELNHFRLNHVI